MIKQVVVFLAVVFTLVAVFRLLYEGTKMKMYIPESTLLVITGLVCGLIIASFNTPAAKKFEDAFTFPSDVFLYFFVPVIIFDATYYLNKHAFFHNFLEIVVYAVLGTLISNLILGYMLIYSQKYMTTPFTQYDHLTYAALISAIDPVAVIAIMESMHVNENIYNIAFGESTLNDGVAIALFNLFRGLGSLEEAGDGIGLISILAVAKFLVIIFGAIILATFITLVFCLITRISGKIPTIELLLMIICAMASYVLSDMFLFSGVVGVMTCALVLVRYGEFNLQPKSALSF